MEYVTIKRFKREGIGGRFNIPYGATLTEGGGTLYYKGAAVAIAASAAGHKHFARNADGFGLLRGKLTRAIVDALRPRKGETPEQRDRRWDPIWADPRCQPYRKETQADHWLWNDAFYNLAPIEDLTHIAALAGAGKGL